MVLFLYFLSWAILSRGNAATPSPAGSVVNVNGEVLLRNENSPQPHLHALKNGESIFPGDVLNTSSRGSVKLLMTDKTILDLGPTTLFKVDDYLLKSGFDRDVLMTMSYGKIRASVNTPVSKAGHFKIRTKAAVMGVRGTEFIVAADLGEISGIGAEPTKNTGGAQVKNQNQAHSQAQNQAKTQITVIHGSVEVSQTNGTKAQPISVGAGKQLTAAAAMDDGKETTRAPASESKPKVVELSVSELKAQVEQAKVEDKTFKQAVVIDRDSGPSTGASTLAAVEFSLEMPSQFGPQFSDLGVPGINLPPANANNRLTGVPITLQVVFKK